jgi:hypothetical protein
MIKELDTVVLKKDIDEYGLKEGDIGAIVHCYKGDQAYEVEFVSANGKTVAVLTLRSTDIRQMESQEILHVRSFTPISN